MKEKDINLEKIKLTKTKWREFFGVTFGTKKLEFDSNGRPSIKLGNIDCEACLIPFDNIICVYMTINKHTIKNLYFKTDTFEYCHSYITRISHGDPTGW